MYKKKDNFQTNTNYNDRIYANHTSLRVKLFNIWYMDWWQHTTKITFSIFDVHLQRPYKNGKRLSSWFFFHVYVVFFTWMIHASFISFLMWFEICLYVKASIRQDWFSVIIIMIIIIIIYGKFLNKTIQCQVFKYLYIAVMKSLVYILLNIFQLFYHKSCYLYIGRISPCMSYYCKIRQHILLDKTIKCE